MPTPEPRVSPQRDEPQTEFIPPAEGGSYVRQPDGTLRRVEHPTAPAGFERDDKGELRPVASTTSQPKAAPPKE